MALSSLDLRWPWLAVLVGAVVVGLTVWWWRNPGSVAIDHLVSHTGRLRDLPRYRLLVRRRSVLVAVRWLALGAAVAGALVLVARPSEVERSGSAPSRDIVVCLDVSGSMEPVNAAVVRAVRRVVASLPGDRVGLALFDGLSVTKVPLTDDRTYVDEALDEAEEAFRTGDEGYSRSTDGWRSSQVGDGLSSCLGDFDRLEERRGRAILLVSDNRPFGRPVHELLDVARQARDRDVVVHALGAPWTDARPAAAAEFADAAAATGGSLALLDDRDAVPDVVERIDRLERRRLEEPAREVLDDRTLGGAIPLAAGVLGLALLGLRRRR